MYMNISFKVSDNKHVVISIVLMDFFHRLKTKFKRLKSQRFECLMGLAQSVGPNTLDLLPLYPHFSPDDEGRASLRNVVILIFKLYCKTMEKVHKNDTSNNKPSSKSSSIYINCYAM